MATQGRLRGLLRATQMLTGGLSLPVVLLRIAEATRELVGARCAALGVLAPDGGAEFVHTGMPPELVARTGHLHQGKGLLGALIEDPEPVRLARISDDPRSCRSGSATRPSATSTWPRAPGASSARTTRS